ncbi:plasma membrane H+-ATPase [Basidiobolus ranarum]|uniref:Plasma membrane H+-ATPase n=1 Tax=Basidiobolus ranarum TaxID=34480 RepID=A0ABR2VM33_9FUNG
MSEKVDQNESNPNNSVQFEEVQQAPEANESNFLTATSPLDKKSTQQSTAAISIMSDYGWSDDGGPDEDDGDEEGGLSNTVVPEELLQTDPRLGLTSAEVETRRKKYGLNQLSMESESKILKFFLFFCGPIQYVMWVAVVLAGALQDWVDFGVIIVEEDTRLVCCCCKRRKGRTS